MKRFLAILLTLSMILSLAACSSGKPAETTAPATEAATTEAPTEATTEAPTEAATEAPTEAPTEPVTEAPTEAEASAETVVEEKTVAAPAEETVAETEAAVEETEAAVEETEAPTEETEAAEEAPAVMTHEEYIAADLDSAVCVETYVQAHQSWWDGKITVYAQSEDGAYFIYNMACAEEDAAKLVPGTKILVNGFKSEWAGEVEITDATFEIVEGEFVAEAADVTALLGTDELAAHQNEKVAFKGLTVSSISYKNDEPGDDIYVSFTMGDVTADFCVEAYLTGPDSDVYAAVGALNVGDVVDVEGFLYWYNGANTHITAVTVVEAAPVVEAPAEAPDEVVVEEKAAAAEETEAAVEETEAVVEETEAAVEETEAAVEETEAVVEETEAAVEETVAAVEETEAAVEETEAVVEETPAEEAAPAVMTHEEYVAAELDSAVCVETYVQAHQSWWDGKITVYAQSEDGAYFIYNMACSEEDAEKLVPGTKILVNGYKSEWAGEVEITDATFEIVEGEFVAEAADVTALLGTDELAAHQNEKVAFKGLTVSSISYKNDVPGDDIYVSFTMGDVTADFCVEAYLTGPDSDVYTAVGALNVGDVVDVEGFLYWYNGANTHITAVTVVEAVPAATETPAEEEAVAETEAVAEEVAAEEAAPAAMTHEEYVAAELDSAVCVETYVQAHQSWWDGKITVYAQSEDGAYFIYNMACSEEDAEKLVPGTKILVNGYKSEWAGEVEITDATFEIVEGEFVAEAADVTALLGTDELAAHQNEKVAFKGLTVSSISYKNDVPGDDIYVSFTMGDVTADFCVEAYLTGPDSDVYAAVGALNVGDVVDVEGFLYWYNGANTHITAVTVVEAAPAVEAPSEAPDEVVVEEKAVEAPAEETVEETEAAAEETPAEEAASAVMTHEEYMAAELDSAVCVETYVQAHQSWWDGKITVYAQSEDGAYFIYNMACSEEDAEKLVPGTKILVNGYKSEWAGEVEITDATFEIVEGEFVAEPADVTALVGTDELVAHQNEKVLFKGLTVASVSYKNDVPGDDIYVSFTLGEVTVDFCVEAYLTGPDSDVYAAVGALNVGDVVDVEGFLYWYNGVNTHITAVTAA